MPEIYLLLYDKGDFIVRRVELAFSSNLDNDNEVESLEANSFDQMSREEYRSVTNFNIGWVGGDQ